MLFLDVQGTLISDTDKSLIDGAAELIAELNSRKIAYVIITNNTKDLNFLANLRAKGLKIKENAYLDPFFVLKSRLKPCKIAAFGASEFTQSLVELGFELDFTSPKAVLIASYDAFKFEDFALMIELLNSGVQGIAMHETSIYKKRGRLFPGVGAITRMLKYATNAEFEVFGKPSHAFFQSALNLLKMQEKSAKFSDILVISDDFTGDLVEARNLGMKIALVLSGKVQNARNLPLKSGDLVFKSVKNYLEILRK